MVNIENGNNNIRLNIENNNEQFPDMDRLKLIIENYFEQISAVPRLKSDKIIAFFKDWAESNGFEYGTNTYKYTPPQEEIDDDDVEETEDAEETKDTKEEEKKIIEETGENIWIDIPATEGFEDYPNVILQGHWDMVCVEDEKSKKKHNFEEEPIEIIDGGKDRIKANGTSLGADNGIGLAIMMAVATGTKEHGPIRLLITGNEESGCEGAESLDPAVLNSDYLINLDYETIGHICHHCAGNNSITIKNNKPFFPDYLLNNEVICALMVKDLIGGHSGLDINEGRLPANVVLTTFFDELIKNGIYPKLSTIKSGKHGNAISKNAYVIFAIPKDRQQDVADIRLATRLKLSALSSEEDDPKRDPREKPPREEFSIITKFYDYIPDNIYFESTHKSFKSKNFRFLNPDVSCSILQFLSNLPQGVKSFVDDKSSETSSKKDVLPETSSNTGGITLRKGILETKICARSFDDKQLPEIGDEISQIAKTYLGEFDLDIQSNSALSWEEDAKSPLVKLAVDGYKDQAKAEREKEGQAENDESTKKEPKVVAVHAGLECSIFALKKPGIHLVSMGPTIEGAHSINETLHTDTLEPCIHVVNYCLKNINSINNTSEVEGGNTYTEKKE